jgi:hypothetical protein
MGSWPAGCAVYVLWAQCMCCGRSVCAVGAVYVLWARVDMPARSSTPIRMAVAWAAAAEALLRVWQVTTTVQVTTTGQARTLVSSAPAAAPASCTHLRGRLLEVVPRQDDLGLDGHLASTSKEEVRCLQLHVHIRGALQCCILERSQARRLRAVVVAAAMVWCVSE